MRGSSRVVADSVFADQQNGSLVSAAVREASYRVMRRRRRRCRADTGHPCSRAFITLAAGVRQAGLLGGTACRVYGAVGNGRGYTGEGEDCLWILRRRAVVVVEP